MYYPKAGRQIDGNEVPIERVNYVLRAASPHGEAPNHFRFEPKVVQQGSAVQIGAIVSYCYFCSCSKGFIH